MRTRSIAFCFSLLVACDQTVAIGDRADGQTALDSSTPDGSIESRDASMRDDATADAGSFALLDAGDPDRVDAGLDAGFLTDAGVDVGFDAGLLVDSGSDAGVSPDAGSLAHDAGVATDAGSRGSVCGDGLWDPGSETCDIAIVGETGSCPTSCDDSIACTSDQLVGTMCTTECSHQAITTCRDGDGCCPSGCVHAFDSDCMCEPPSCEEQYCGSLPNECGGEVVCGPTCNQWVRVSNTAPSDGGPVGAHAGPGRAVIWTQGQTWEYDEATDTWTQFAIDAGPTPAASGAGTPAMAYAGDGIVVFIKADSGTWEYDTSSHTWREWPAASGPRRYNTDIAYAGSGRVLLFGGVVPASGPNRGDEQSTFAYSTASHVWTELVIDGAAPPARSDHRLEWLGEGRVIMVGGTLGDAWVFDTSTRRWSGIASPRGGSIRRAMLAHAGTGSVLFYGGILSNSSYSREFYRYDAASNTWMTWTGTPSDPGGVAAAAMAWLGDGRVMMHGGAYQFGNSVRVRMQTNMFYLQGPPSSDFPD